MSGNFNWGGPWQPCNLFMELFHDIWPFSSQIGTYTAAITAKAMNKPFYVVAESFKFVRLYPLDQGDIPTEFKVGAH